MTENISPNVESLVKSLNKSHLIGVSLEPMYYSLTLEFMYGYLGYEKIVIRLYDVLHFVFSKTPEDKDEESFFVCAINLTPIQDGGKELFSSLNYLFKAYNDEPVSYPNESLYHLQLEGAACIEVICGSYEVFQKVK